jgi:hypothetical protein
MWVVRDRRWDGDLLLPPSDRIGCSHFGTIEIDFRKLSLANISMILIDRPGKLHGTVSPAKGTTYSWSNNTLNAFAIFTPTDDGALNGFAAGLVGGGHFITFTKD